MGVWQPYIRRNGKFKLPQGVCPGVFYYSGQPYRLPISKNRFVERKFDFLFRGTKILIRGTKIPGAVLNFSSNCINPVDYPVDFLCKLHKDEKNQKNLQKGIDNGKKKVYIKDTVSDTASRKHYKIGVYEKWQITIANPHLIKLF